MSEVTRANRPKKNTRLLYFSLVLFLIGVVVSYHHALVLPALDRYTDDETFSHIANIHDHTEYQKSVFGLAENADSDLSTTNVAGIASVYLLLSFILGIEDVVSISMGVNIFAIFCAAYFHVKICELCGMHKAYKYAFFLNLPLVYFSQLIGKDALYVALLYAVLFNYLRGNGKIILLCIVLGMMIRVQVLLLLIFALIAHIKFVGVKARLILLYVLSSLIGAFAFVKPGVLGDGADLGEGMTALVHTLNSVTYLGNFLLNPARFVQYIGEFGFFSLSAVVNPENFFQLFLVPFFIFFVLKIAKFRKLFDFSENPLARFFMLNLFLLLIVPIVNLRYFVVLLPFAVLAIGYRSNSAIGHRSFSEFFPPTKAMRRAA